jgi:superoxide dismutase, Fe-Mn family
LDSKSLEEIIHAAKASANQGLFNNSAQVWNHTFYWHSMKQGGGGEPTGPLAEMINKSFGSYAEFKTAFETAGNTQFGSGWSWLVWTEDGLKIVKTGHADTPLTDKDCVPLMCCDVWEHAYYLNFQNLRPKYTATFMDHLVNWDFANSNLPR